MVHKAVGPKDYEPEVEEIKFIRLPNVKDLRAAGANERQLQRYVEQSRMLQQAQRKMAVSAVSILRPEDYKQSNWERQAKVRQANEEHADRMLEVFSATCTRGL